MSRIDDLIRQHCPKGVEYRALREVAQIKNGRDYRAFGTGTVPVYGTGGVMARIDTAAFAGPSVLIPRKGSLANIYYVDEPFWTGDTIFYTVIDESRIVPKFLFYVLVKMRLQDLNQAGGVPSLTQTMLNPLRIPVPPLEVQREIVAILDTFSGLEAELEAELEGRRRQYLHYRRFLLSHGPDTPRRKLGEVFEMKAGKHMPAARIFPNQTTEHPYPCFGGNGVRGYVSATSHSGHRLLVGRQGALCGNVKRVNEGFFATEHAVVLSPCADTDMNWAFHLLDFMDLNQYKTKSAQPGLAVSKLAQVLVPVPDVAEQHRIAEILDSLHALVNDLSSGLPAEIAARRKQYEHYRDRLLTFPEAAA